MKIAHFGDLHVADGPRGDDAARCALAGLADAADAGVDLIVFSGDLFDAKSTPTERNTLLGILQRAAEIAPVIAVYGNHDYPGDLDIYREVKAPHQIRVFDRPEMIDFHGVLVCVLPYPTKAWLHAGQDLGKPDADAQAAGALQTLLTAWGSELRRHTVPSLFVAHLNVAGSRASTGQPLIGRELEVAPGDLLDLGCTYYALGHIHARQSFAPNCWYAGSISRQDFGEMEPKGWNLVHISDDGSVEVDFQELPARPMLHVDGSWEDHGFNLEGNEQDAAGADVRVRYTVSEEKSGAVDEELLRNQYAEAHSLKIERVVVRTERVRSESIAVARSLREKLEAWWGATARPGDPEDARLLDKAAALQDQPSELLLEEVRHAAA